MLSYVKSTAGYQMIRQFYGERTAKRSKVPLINHIHEGLAVLEDIGAGIDAAEAFCIHPMIQADEDLKANYSYVARNVDANVLALAMEYRSVANEYLSDKADTGHKIRLSPLEEVNNMLIADKVQNRKDFYTYHYDTHPRSHLLEMYFIDWMEALDISNDEYAELCNGIEAAKVFENEFAELKRKVQVYESTLHKIDLYAMTGSEKFEQVIQGVCNWSRSHRAGNGELTEREEIEQIELALQTLKDKL